MVKLGIEFRSHWSMSDVSLSCLQETYCWSHDSIIARFHEVLPVFKFEKVASDFVIWQKKSPLQYLKVKKNNLNSIFGVIFKHNINLQKSSHNNRLNYVTYIIESKKFQQKIVPFKLNTEFGRWVNSILLFNYWYIKKSKTITVTLLLLLLICVRSMTIKK